LLDRESALRACTGADIVVAAAHSILGRGRNASIYVDGAGHRQLIDIAKQSAVRHLVFISVYDYGPAESRAQTITLSMMNAKERIAVGVRDRALGNVKSLRAQGTHCRAVGWRR